MALDHNSRVMAQKVVETTEQFSANASAKANLPGIDRVIALGQYRHGAASQVQRKLKNARTDLKWVAENGQELAPIIAQHPILNTIPERWWKASQVIRWALGWGSTGDRLNRGIIAGLGWGLAQADFEELVELHLKPLTPARALLYIARRVVSLQPDALPWWHDHSELNEEILELGLALPKSVTGQKSGRKAPTGAQNVAAQVNGQLQQCAKSLETDDPFDLTLEEEQPTVEAEAADRSIGAAESSSVATAKPSASEKHDLGEPWDIVSSLTSADPGFSFGPFDLSLCFPHHTWGLWVAVRHTLTNPQESDRLKSFDESFSKVPAVLIGVERCRRRLRESILAHAIGVTTMPYAGSYALSCLAASGELLKVSVLTTFKSSTSC